MFLNRPSSVESPTGLFCCEVPDATNTNQTLCVDIGELHNYCLFHASAGLKICFVSLGGVSVTGIPSGSPMTAGENYTLECSVGGSEGNFQWLKGPPDGRTPVVNSDSTTISFTSTSSQLQFRPIQQSDNGLYVCNYSVGELSFVSEPVIIIVNGNILLR